MVKLIQQMGANLHKNKVTAIVEIPPPSSKKEVQSFIGMVNYLTKFWQGLPSYPSQSEN